MKHLQAVERSALSVPSQLSFLSQISKDALRLYDAFLLDSRADHFNTHTPKLLKYGTKAILPNNETLTIRMGPA
jgi:hypothetical protein